MYFMYMVHAIHGELNETYMQKYTYKLPYITIAT